MSLCKQNGGLVLFTKETMIINVNMYNAPGKYGLSFESV